VFYCELSYSQLRSPVKNLKEKKSNGSQISNLQKKSLICVIQFFFNLIPLDPERYSVYVKDDHKHQSASGEAADTAL
jgi:hypothetical protein